MTTGKVRIISTIPGFRRGGISHPADRTYPAGHFTEEQLETFRADPVLKVLDCDQPGAAGESDDTAALKEKLAEALAARDASVTKLHADAAAYSERMKEAKAEISELDEKFQLALNDAAEKASALESANAEIAALKKAAAEKKTGGK